MHSLVVSTISSTWIISSAFSTGYKPDSLPAYLAMALLCAMTWPAGQRQHRHLAQRKPIRRGLPGCLELRKRDRLVLERDVAHLETDAGNEGTARCVEVRELEGHFWSDIVKIQHSNL